MSAPAPMNYNRTRKGPVFLWASSRPVAYNVGHQTVVRPCARRGAGFLSCDDFCDNSWK